MKNLTISAMMILLLLAACEEFQDEEYELLAVDAAALTSLGDTLTKDLDFGIGSQWIYQLTFKDTLEDTILAAFDSLHITGTTAEYYWAVNAVVDIDHDFSIRLPNAGGDFPLNYDTTYTVIDTVTMTFDIADSIAPGDTSYYYSVETTYTRAYPQPYIIITWGNGTRDSLVSPDIDGTPTDVELFDALEALDVMAEPNDTCYVAHISADSVSYQLLDIPTAGNYVIYLMHYATPNLFGLADGNMTPIELVSDNMEPTLIAGMTTASGISPAVKGRYEWQLEAGTYFLEIERLEATVRNDFRIAIVQDEE